MRKLLDGREVPELEKPKMLTVHTKCPEKWILIDTETGEVYNGHVTDGKNSWIKTKDSLKWTPPDA